MVLIAIQIDVLNVDNVDFITSVWVDPEALKMPVFLLEVFSFALNMIKITSGHDF